MWSNLLIQEMHFRLKEFLSPEEEREVFSHMFTIGALADQPVHTWDILKAGLLPFEPQINPQSPWVKEGLPPQSS